MQVKYLLLVLSIGVLWSCKKNNGSVAAHVPPPGAPLIPAPQLKEIVIPNVPSPYYHFEYDNEGKTVVASFAADLTRYNIQYNNGRITELKNNNVVNKDRLQYFYNNAGQVTTINYADSTGEVYKQVKLFYKDGKLSGLVRLHGLVEDKRISMQYYADGNLSDITYEFQSSRVRKHFENYDNNKNVDGFDLLHDEFFDHLIFLPGVQLQKNNPAKETRTGDGANYTITYSYTYNAKNVPEHKAGELVYTSGPNAGQRFRLNAFYTYY